MNFNLDRCIHFIKILILPAHKKVVLHKWCKHNGSAAVPTRIIFFAASLLLLSGLTGCGGSSKADKQTDTLPVAVAEVLGAPQVNKIALVRSGAEVLLTAQNSKGVDDPILHYQWSQVDTSGYPVDLFERANNVTAFTAPDISLTQPQGVELSFRVKITDSDGVSATSDVKVSVLPVKDVNRFLMQPTAASEFILFVAAEPGEIVDTDIAAQLTVTAEAEWRGRDALLHKVNLSERSYNGVVPIGIAPEITDSKNLFFRMPLPELDVDEINKHFTGANRLGRLEFEAIASARITLSIHLSQPSGTPLSVYLTDAGASFVVDLTASSAAANENTRVEKTQKLSVSQPIIAAGAHAAVIDVETLRQALVMDSARSASQYYGCIDPNNKTNTLADWLLQSGFTADPASDVHTQYVNNYDLGFGRDMHMRKDQNGNVYSYVINYPTLENTLSKRKAFAVVAMEFSPAPKGNCGEGGFEDVVTGKKIVKFYAFIPDEIKGGFIRSESMNFDGRGEKFLPGACTACHFGDNHTQEFSSHDLIDAKYADLNSAFMPWDLDALLYTQATNAALIDPDYAAVATANNIHAEKRKATGREAQEALFKQQNQWVLDTYTQNAAQLLRYQQAIKTVHGWYGSSAEAAATDALNFGTTEVPLSDVELSLLQQKVKKLPARNFNGAYVPQSWRVSPAAEELYVQVYERTCRICHIHSVNTKTDFDHYAEFVNHPKLRSYLFEQGSMPLSRLTMDRFWIDFNGKESPASLLRKHLNSDANVLNNIPLELIPGKPVAIVMPDINVDADSDVQLDFDDDVLFDATQSIFSNSVVWRVNDVVADIGAKALVDAGNKFTFIPTAPGEKSRVSLQVANTDFQSEIITRRVAVNNYTPAINSLSDTTVNEGKSVRVNIYQQLCPAHAVDEKICRPVFGDIKKTQSPSINLVGTPINGTVTINSLTGDVEFTSTAAQAVGDGAFVITLTDSFGEVSAPKTINVRVSSSAAPIVAADFCVVNAKTTAASGAFPQIFNTLTCPDPKANDTAALGLSLQIINVDSSSQYGGSITLNNGVMTYSPPRFFVGTDTFSYWVQDNSLSQKVSQGAVIVSVNASIPFTTIKAGIASGCPSCHLINTSVLGPNWRDYATIIAALDETVGSQNGALLLTQTTTEVDILNTGLFKYACGDSNHTGGNKLCDSSRNGVAPTSYLQLNSFGQKIFTWIEEGAKNN